MLVNEIEVLGSSISFKIYSHKAETLEQFFDAIKNADQFNTETELPGFHDAELSGGVVRGFYSAIIPFEIEHLVEGITTKTLFKRIESCEFIAAEKHVFVSGKAALFKIALNQILAVNIQPAEFEFDNLRQLEERFTNTKSVTILNPKEKEVRKAKLVGNMENYAEYNIADSRNHGLESVAGMLDTPLGPMAVTVSSKGVLRLGVKKGMILTVECLEWIVERIEKENAPEISSFQTF